MKRMLLLAGAVVALTSCNSINSKGNREAIKKQADAMINSLLHKDYKAFTDVTYPSIVQRMGGKEQMINMMQSGIATMEASGTTFVKASIGEPSEIIQEKKQLQSVVPETLEVKVPNGRLVSNSSLIAVSDDGGKKWFFIDVAGKDLSQLREIMPELSTKLKVPAAQQPKMIAD